MSDIVVLDTNILGKITHPNANYLIYQWFKNLLNMEIEVCIPEITDYELRRELLRSKKNQSITRLNNLKNVLFYLPLNTEIMLIAAEYWAMSRNKGYPTSGDSSIDGDVILAAQGKFLINQGYDVIVATENVKHISNFINATHWENI